MGCVDARSVANRLLSLGFMGSKTYGLLHLNLLTVLCDHHWQEITGDRLVCEPISIKRRIPVFLSVHEAVKHFGPGKVVHFYPYVAPIEGKPLELIDAVYEVYSQKETHTLVAYAMMIYKTLEDDKNVTNEP